MRKLICYLIIICFILTCPGIVLIPAWAKHNPQSQNFSRDKPSVFTKESKINKRKRPRLRIKRPPFNDDITPNFRKDTNDSFESYSGVSIKSAESEWLEPTEPALSMSFQISVNIILYAVTTSN